MGHYAGIDLHSSNSMLAIEDENGKRLFKRKLHNNLAEILAAIEPHRDKLDSIAVESTYNWYWLVDGLMDSGLDVRLVNTTAARQYSGIKHIDDTHDAFWLAEMLRLGILPTGYIYPKEDRPIRDLLRKRSHLVSLRTSLMISLSNIIARNNGFTVTGNEIKRLKRDTVTPLLSGNMDIELSGKVSKQAIDFFTRQIRQVEKAVESRAGGLLKDKYANILTIPGIGKVLGLTIALETGEIGRFKSVGDYASYARLVPSVWTSNDKLKGRGNTKNGNKYLSWAFSEASVMARRNDEVCRRFYQKKMPKKNIMVAHKALAHKLARAAYFIMRDNVPFDREKLFT
jgi:transposase